MESIMEPEPSRVSDEVPVPVEVSDIKDMIDTEDRLGELKLLKEEQVDLEPSKVSDEGPAEISDIKDLTDSVDSMYRHSELKLLKEEQVSATPVQVEQSISNEGVNLMENECKDKERPSNKGISHPCTSGAINLKRRSQLDGK
ncbi:uncharacterized protein LOC111063504 isoform X2 [Nilaparvata lugens]|uniref:uncharacterized protein LOC111063504 isoform X2 n=1 Tax=Nilaparvata lugens TaxID=108931 RepID=UPI00193D1299|nr:uncharacterized protein LOC111063504 isoform X2 [Nilaparvata lugens]